MKVKTLIITVGTRQVGWRCSDGIVRSLGADGGASPTHIGQVYTLELEQERGFHEDRQSWSVRHIGEQLYALCEAKQDFSNVELLMDAQLVEQEVKDGLSQVVLWGTDQPEDVSWKFRRSDTLWLAQLIAGRLRQLYPALSVAVWSPVLPANDPVRLCQSVEDYILQDVLHPVPEEARKDFTLLIENKGSVPLIASALEMCAVALSRQCHVKLIMPTEPDPLFAVDNEARSAQSCTHYSYLPIGKYFWPLEKPKIISAWQRGDFGEAQMWLFAHRDRHKPLYDLAGYLALATNGNIKAAIKQIKNQWPITGKKIRGLTTVQEHQDWLSLSENLVDTNQSTHHRYAWIWERMFLFEIELTKKSNSNAFLSFAQTLEALLSLQFDTDDWVKRGYVGQDVSYPPNLWTLIEGWKKKHSIPEDSPWHFCLDQIRVKRNKVAHENMPLTGEEMNKFLSVVSVDSSKSSFNEVTSDTLIEQMRFILRELASPESIIPQDILLRSLYQRGLERLKTEA